MASNFDQAAGTWDNNPIHIERSEAIANKLIRKLTLNKGLSALEYGAGTGILSFLLKDYLGDIVLMDNSSEMIKVIKEKIHTNGVKSFRPMFFDLENQTFKKKKFDVIFCQMVLHHVINIEHIVNAFYRLLKGKGQIAIADLYREDGSFHGEGFTGHNGFNADELGNILKNAGFANVAYEQCYVIRRQIESDEEKEFPLFLMTAEKG